MSVMSPLTRSRESTGLPTEQAALDLVQLQARPHRVAISLEGDGRPPAPVPATTDDRCVPLPTGLARRQAYLTHPPRPGDPTVPADADAVLAIVGAAGVQRLEPRSAVNPHRAYPAAHCFFAATVWVLAAGSAWVFDPVHHRLVPTGGEALASRDPVGCFRSAVHSDGGAVLAVLGQLEAMPERYHELRWSLVLTECGHLGELLVHGARAIGVPVRTQDHFVDTDLLAASGARGHVGLVPATVLELGAADTAGTLSAAPFTPAPPCGPPTGSAADLEGLDRLGWHTTDPGRPPRDRSARTGPQLTGSAPWPEVLFERSAARANKGMTARPDPLPADAAHDLVAALRDALGPGHPALGAGQSTAEASHSAYLVAGRVQGRDPGLHEITDEGATVLVRELDGMAALQEVFSYPRVEMSVDSCPAALVLTTDYRHLLEDAGPRALRLSQVDNGRALQAAGLALTLHDAFLRPARSYDTDRLAELLHLPDGTLPVYVGLVGQSRFTDLLMDVRP